MVKNAKLQKQIILKQKPQKKMLLVKGIPQISHQPVDTKCLKNSRELLRA